MGMDKSVSVQPALDYSEAETTTPGCFCPPFGEEFYLTVLNAIVFFSRKSIQTVDIIELP